MALFSFRHSTKTFSAKVEKPSRKARVGQTAAHLRYISRPQAARVLMQERLSSTSLNEVARTAEKEAQRRKGRVAERFIIALPIEASAEQRVALVRAFCELITKKKAGFVAAIHDIHGNDQLNPHAHLVLFDEFERNGKRGRPKSVIGMARKHAVEKAACEWARLHNRMMISWGFDEASTIDHRSFRARGITQIPTIHEGAAGRAIKAKGCKPKVKAEWNKIDAGHTRSGANELIQQINKYRAQIDERNGLAKRHGEHRDGGQSGVGQGGSGSGGSGTATPRATPPFLQSKEVDARTRSATLGDRGVDRRTEENPTSAREQPTFTALAFHRRFARRGSVRRIFVELLMLRDTLRTRLSFPKVSGLGQSKIVVGCPEHSVPLLSISQKTPLTRKELQR
jgi:hypothetical protein